MASTFEKLDLARVPSPCFVLDEVALERNLSLLARVQAESGARILLALKAFSMFAVAPQVMRHLHGTAASGPWEARLGREDYGGEVHCFSPAYTEQDLAEVLTVSDHVVFNSVGQWDRFRRQALGAQVERPGLRFGMRVNPEHSEGATEIYDPCAPCSRLGATRASLEGVDLDGLSGLHFHTLSEQGLGPLERTLAAVEQKFGHLFERMDWINFGGGHLITDGTYDVDGLIGLLTGFAERTGLQVYLEPGEAVALGAGVLVTEIADLTHNEMPIAIVDVSATCHMPDVIEAPYRPEILGAHVPGNGGHTYRIGGPTCLSGDVLGDYAFEVPLEVGQRLVIEDQAYYTMVKTSTFNGMKLPAIALWNSDTDAFRIVKSFGYGDFRNRLS